MHEVLSGMHAFLRCGSSVQLYVAEFRVRPRGFLAYRCTSSGTILPAVAIRSCIYLPRDSADQSGCWMMQNRTHRSKCTMRAQPRYRSFDRA